jgi:hypothetical protein
MGNRFAATTGLFKSHLTFPWVVSTEGLEIIKQRETYLSPMPTNVFGQLFVVK